MCRAKQLDVSLVLRPSPLKQAPRSLTTLRLESTMKTLALIFLGVTSCVVAAQETSDRQAKQMPFDYVADPYAYFYNLPIPLLLGLPAKQEPRPSSQQVLFRSNAQDFKGNVAELSNYDEPSVEPLGRLFLNGNIGFAGPSVSNNFLIKTSYVFTTATGTVCTLTTCIPVGQFVAGSENVICRRKRRDEIEARGGSIADELADVSRPEPSQVKTVAETTILDPNFEPIPEGRDMMMSSYPVLESSLDAPSDEPHSAKTKRFAFILTTILTTYALTSTTYTITLNPGDLVLECRPSGFAICPPN